MSSSTVIVIVTPQQLGALRGTSAVPAHMAYRMGKGPHLFRSGGPVAPRGGLMVLDCSGFDGAGDAALFCREVVQECRARNFSGVICDFEGGPLPFLAGLLHQLEQACLRSGLDLLVPESFAPHTQRARVLVSSALSGGSLVQRLEEARDRFGERAVLALQRTAEDFFLPSPSGCGEPLSRAELRRRMDRLRPAVFFSRELCARYFTYMSRESGAHFVLFDDKDTLAKKLEVARSLGISTAVAAFPEVQDALDSLGLRPSLR